MTGKEITVIAYAGYKGEERPRSFVLEGETIDVSEVLKIWVEENLQQTTRQRRFAVQGGNGYHYLVSYDEQNGKWSVICK